MTKLPLSTAATILVLLAIAFSLATFFRSTGGQIETPDDPLARMQKTGSIEACTIVYPPTVIKDAKTGKLSGQFIDVLNIIAEKVSAKVNWHESTWGNAAADLQSHRCDIVAAGFFANIPRAAAVAFTKPPLFYVGESAVIRKNDMRFQDVQDASAFDKPDITIAVATGESGDIFVKEHFRHAKVTRIDVESSDLSRFMTEVAANRADVAIADSNTVALYVAQHPELKDVFAKNPFGLNPVGWAVRQQDTAWLHFIETSLQFLETQGTMRNLEQQYGAHWLHQVQEFTSE